MHATHVSSLWILLIFLPVLIGCAGLKNTYHDVWNGSSGFGHPPGPVSTDL